MDYRDYKLLKEGRIKASGFWRIRMYLKSRQGSRTSLKKQKAPRSKESLSETGGGYT